jgi:hypothetical protein
MPKSYPSEFRRRVFQGVARTSREGDRDELAAANSELDRPPERGVPRSGKRQRTDHHQTSGGPTHWRAPILTDAIWRAPCRSPSPGSPLSVTREGV